MIKSKSFCLLTTSQSVKRMPHTLPNHVPFFSTWCMSDYKDFHHSEEDCIYHTVHGHYYPSSFWLGILTFVLLYSSLISKICA